MGNHRAGDGDGEPRPGRGPGPGPGPGDDTPAVGDAAAAAADIMDAPGEDLSGSDSDFEVLETPPTGEYDPGQYAAERARNPSGGGEKHKVETLVKHSALKPL